MTKITNQETPALSDVQAHLDVNEADAQLLIKKQQEIPTSFLDRLKAKRDASRNAPMGDLHHVASIPVAIVEKWMSEGFNIFDRNNSVKDIVARLQSEDMQAFMATERRV